MVTPAVPRLDSAVTSAIRQMAGRYGLDPDLLTAQVIVESGGNPWAWNPEPAYRYFWDVRAGKPFRALSLAEVQDERPPADFPFLAGDRDQEWWGQQASWGLLQVMGAVAREYRFTGPYLTQLCDPVKGLECGCQVLAVLKAWANGDAEQMLAGYNGGRGGNAQRPFRNQEYATRVMSTLGTIKGVAQ